MQDTYVNMQDSYVYVKHNYVDKQKIAFKSKSSKPFFKNIKYRPSVTSNIPLMKKPTQKQMDKVVSQTCTYMHIHVYIS